jgi:DNA gyrase subunit A
VTETTLPPGSGERIEPVDIQQEMQRSYIDYAMSVIVGRALPLVEDGLKPVHRRVLYSMYDSGFRPDRSYVKWATTTHTVTRRSTTPSCGWPSRGRCATR